MQYYISVLINPFDAFHSQFCKRYEEKLNYNHCTYLWFMVEGWFDIWDTQIKAIYK